jgi:hypothetical protein
MAWKEVGEIIEEEYGEIWRNPDESMKEELNTLFRDYLRLKEIVSNDLGSEKAMREYL